MATNDAVFVEEPMPGVRLLTLNRPRIRNAITEEMSRRWTELMDELEVDQSVRVLVVTGAGPAFCAGATMSWLDQGATQEVTPDALHRRMLPFYRSWLRPRSLPFPVIAAVNGPAVGAGVCLALACDLRYAAPGAVFSTPFLHLGTHGGMGASWLLPEAVGLTRAREMLYTGREVKAGEAREWGLVNAVEDDILPYTMQVAERIAAAAPIATRLQKAGLEHAAAQLDAALRWEGLAQPVTMNTSDLHEGIEARLQGRAAIFQGR